MCLWSCWSLVKSVQSGETCNVQITSAMETRHNNQIYFSFMIWRRSCDRTCCKKTFSFSYSSSRHSSLPKKNWGMSWNGVVELLHSYPSLIEIYLLISVYRKKDFLSCAAVAQMTTGSSSFFIVTSMSFLYKKTFFSSSKRENSDK